jgi:hypothetical protein
MHGVASTLHHKMKYVYDNKVYQVEIDLEPEIFLQVEKGMTSHLNTLIPTSKIEPPEELKLEGNVILKLLGDDWGTLEFTPSFMEDEKQ